MNTGRAEEENMIRLTAGRLRAMVRENTDDGEDRTVIRQGRTRGAGLFKDSSAFSIVRIMLPPETVDTAVEGYEHSSAGQGLPMHIEDLFELGGQCTGCPAPVSGRSCCHSIIPHPMRARPGHRRRRHVNSWPRSSRHR